MSPFEVHLGDNAELEMAQRQASLDQALAQARKVIDHHDNAVANIEAWAGGFKDEAEQVRTLIGQVERDIDLWDVRAGALNRLCRLAVGLSAIVGLTEIAWLAGHLIR